RVGDPSLVLGYRVPGRAEYVDESGTPVDTARASRGSTPVVVDGEPIAVLVTHPATGDDPALASGAIAALRFAVGNALVGVAGQARVADVATSRRRIVEAVDAQHRAIEHALIAGPERRLQAVAEILDRPELAADPGLAGQLPMVRAEVTAGQAELRQFAQG